LVNIDIDPYQLRTVQRIMRLVNTVTTAHDKMVMDEFRHLVVKLPAGGYGTTEFDLNDAERNALVESGRRAMTDYFNKQRQEATPVDGEETEAEKARRVADEIATRLLQA
jgi:hypothetical protein